MTSALVDKLSAVRDFRKILETTVKEIGETFDAEVSQIVLSNPLDTNITSICQYLANPDETPPDDLVCATFPLHLEGGGLGLLNISRYDSLNEAESNEIRITLAEISNLLRYAQINDIVQRETFRNAFMAEITSMMQLPMGLGDTLFMVVNILGKALNCNRCLFICTDEHQAGWKCYEYWQRERVESAQEYGWPTKDSAIVSQSLLCTSPLVVFEGQSQSYLTPVQEEMQFLGVRSMLSVAIRSSMAVHGCIILHACESRHAWTRDEIVMVQNVADTVAEALVQLPEERKVAEPIMRLHQRDVAETLDAESQNIQDIRKALKGALGQTAIPSARKAAKEPKPEPKERRVRAKRAVRAAEAAQSGGTEPSAPVRDAAPASIGAPTWEQAAGGAQEAAAYPAADFSPAEPAPAAAWDTGTAAGFGPEETSPVAPPPEEGAFAVPPSRPSLKGILGGILGNTKSGAGSLGAWDVETSQPQPPPPEAGGGQESPPPAPARPVFEEPAAPSTQPEVPVEEGIPDEEWKVEATGAPTWEEPQGAPDWTDRQMEAAEAEFGGQNVPPDVAPQADAGVAWSPATETVVGGGSRWGDLDAIPTPGAAKGKGGADPQAQAGAQAVPPKLAPVEPAGPQAAQPAAQSMTAGGWGDLDSIPTPGRGTVPAAKPAGKWGDLDATPAPKAGGADQASSGSWGIDLDSIPTPANVGKTGLGGAMLGRARASSVSGGGLGMAFQKAKQGNNVSEPPPAPVPAAPPPGPALPPAQPVVSAEDKVRSIMAGGTNPTTDYIFENLGLDARLLGRIDGWVTQVEAKDKYVHGHARAVAEYSCAVARLLGMEEDEINQVRLAAVVHDVGKLAVPQSVLQKPDEELSDAELVQTMNHPIDGAKLLDGFPELKGVAPIVLSHHEEYDGNGYPNGFAGEGIPLASRIIAVADAYHMLTTDLTFRGGLPPAEAQAQLKEGAGQQFDPNVVDALLACISQGLVKAKIS